MKKWMILCFCVGLIFTPLLYAKTVTFEKEYTYDAGEADSKLSCRTISLLQVKRLLLEELGTYLEAETLVVNYQLTKDQITFFTAGIVKTEIMEETWNGYTYWVKAKIDADPDAIAQSINELRQSREGTDNIKKIEAANEKYLEKIDELKSQMQTIQQDLVSINRDYTEASQIIFAWESYEAAEKFRREGNYREALDAYNQAIEQNPTYRNYHGRGRAYAGLKKYRAAIKDFNKAIELDPGFPGVYFQKGKALRKIGKKRKGIANIKKAASMGHGGAMRWLKLKGH
jgi:tetratricopeptide (TPR) repeat protein